MTVHGHVSRRLPNGLLRLAPVGDNGFLDGERRKGRLYLKKCSLVYFTFGCTTGSCKKLGLAVDGP